MLKKSKQAKFACLPVLLSNPVLWSKSIGLNIQINVIRYKRSNREVLRPRSNEDPFYMYYYLEAEQYFVHILGDRTSQNATSSQNAHKISNIIFTKETEP